MTTGTSTLNVSSPGKFIGAENPATRVIFAEQSGQRCSWPDSVFVPGDAIALIHAWQNWWLQGRTLMKSA